MTRHARAITTCALATALLAAPAAALARGTHFILEGQAAGLLTDTTDLGQASTLAVGYGGSFRRLPSVIFYITGQVGFDWFDAARDRTGAGAKIAQRDVLYSFGPRVYLAFTPRVRVYLDLLLGGYWGQSTWTLNGVEDYTAVDQGLAFVAGFGLQYRFIEALSIGLRLDRCEFAGRINRRNLAAFLGFPEPREDALLARTRIGLTITAHF